MNIRSIIVGTALAVLAVWNTAAQSRYPWLEQASTFISKNNIESKRPVVVAIVDTGFDISHPAISPFLWTNRLETAGDGIDNDGNGYTDDTHGWNFLGNAQGVDIESNGTAEYREFKRLRPLYREVDTLSLSGTQLEEYRHYLDMAEKAHIPSLLQVKAITEAQVEEMQKNPEEGSEGFLEYFKNKLEDVSAKVAQLDVDDDVHRKAGNDPDDFSDFHYGNSHIGVNPYHGTMVAGVVALTAAQCGADVRLMLIRAVPDRGDEYDKDVAASIRYAVNNGADIVNLSLGKTFSPHQEEVAEAIRYAASHDVLIVEAAGNSGEDNDAVTSYPSPYDLDGKRHGNLLVVGSVGDDGQKAKFSNFGTRTVDIFAPGKDIESCSPEGGFEASDGTSMSAPIVTGVAAVMKAFGRSMDAVKTAEILKGTADGQVLNAGEALKAAIGPFVDWEKVRRFSSDSLYKKARNSYVSVKWTTAKGKDAAYWDIDTEDGDTEYMYFIPKLHKKPRRMFLSTELYPLLADVDSARTAKYAPEGIRVFPDFKSEDVISFEWGEWTIRYSISGKKIVSREKTPQKERAPLSSGKDYWKKWSADSCFYVYSQNHEIYLAGKDESEGRCLSEDGELYHSFSLSGSRPSNSFDKPGYALGNWISGTHSFFILREDSRKVGTMSIINSLKEPRPEVTTYKYALPGDKDVPQYECFIVNADSSSIKRIQADKWKDQKLLIPKYRGVNTTSDAAWVLRVNRELDSLELCRIDATSGEMKVIIAEECKPHYNETLFDYHLLNDGKEILWWSEREGKGAWYLYDGSGKLKNKVAGGDFVAGTVTKIDTTGRSMVFCGYGYKKDVNPEYDFYFKAGFDGKKLVCLTPENGHHTIEISKSGKYISDTYSRIDAAPKTRIYDMEGHESALVSETDLSGAYACGWKEPEIIRVKAADGKTDLWGVVYLPADMEQGKKYPVISHVYPGPQTDLMPKAFAFDDDGNHSMAQMGCVVVNFMHRGSNPWMGKEFSDYGYGNLRDYPLDDDKAIIEQVAERYGCIDLEKVGIFGHSGGGFMSATALMTYPDFYKVAVAASGNYDNNIYTIMWGEAYHGVQRDSTGTYVSKIPVTQELAPRLKGKLLLITGDVDNNVNPASTMRLADALIKAGKRFDMLVIPGADHDIGNKYFDNAVRHYFLEHLLGVQSDDIDIVKKR